MGQSLDIDLTAESFMADPHACFAAMSQAQGLYLHTTPSGRRIWYVTRYDDAMAALTDPRLVMSFHNALSADEIAAAPPTPPFFRLLLKNLLGVDPPAHGRMRRLVSKAFTPRRIERLRPRVEKIADELIAIAKPQGQMDLIAQFAFPLPIVVICELLGIPAADRDEFRRWSDTLFYAVDLDQNTHKLRAIEQAVHEFEAYAQRLIAKRRADPADDLVSALIRAEEAGDQLDQEELISMMLLLLIAGHETSVNLIANGVLALLKNPGALAAVGNDPELLPAAVEEMLRFDGALKTTSRRWVAEAMHFAGEDLRRGDMLVVAVLGANRDPNRFECPHVFDPHRQPSRHLAFGHGIHFCLGAPLARLEAQVAIGALLRELPGIRLQCEPDELTYKHNNMLHGLQILPVSW